MWVAGVTINVIFQLYTIINVFEKLFIEKDWLGFDRRSPGCRPGGSEAGVALLAASRRSALWIIIWWILSSIASLPFASERSKPIKDCFDCAENLINRKIRFFYIETMPNFFSQFQKNIFQNPNRENLIKKNERFFLRFHIFFRDFRFSHFSGEILVFFKKVQLFFWKVKIFKMIFHFEKKIFFLQFFLRLSRGVPTT